MKFKKTFRYIIIIYALVAILLVIVIPIFFVLVFDFELTRVISYVEPFTLWLGLIGIILANFTFWLDIDGKRMDHIASTMGVNDYITNHKAKIQFKKDQNINFRWAVNVTNLSEDPYYNGVPALIVPYNFLSQEKPKTCDGFIVALQLESLGNDYPKQIIINSLALSYSPKKETYYNKIFSKVEISRLSPLIEAYIPNMITLTKDIYYTGYENQNIIYPLWKNNVCNVFLNLFTVVSKKEKLCNKGYDLLQGLASEIISSPIIKIELELTLCSSSQVETQTYLICTLEKGKHCRYRVIEQFNQEIDAKIAFS